MIINVLDFQRIQLLYRPPLEESTQHSEAAANNNSDRPPAPSDGSNPNATPPTPQPDPPPKYTPPPSYSTATGARIAKMLRQSIRRSIRGVRRYSKSEDVEFLYFIHRDENNYAISTLKTNSFIEKLIFTS